MSEYNFSISSRRSSTSSKITSIYNVFNDNEFSINAFKRTNWFDAFNYLKENEQLFADNHELLIDQILKLLFDDTLIKEVVIHLLSLLEHFYYYFKVADL